MSDKCAMPVSKALDFADEWTDGITFYPGSEGWRVVCKTLAAEVRRLRQGGGELPMSREQIEKEMGKCFQVGRAAHSTRENMIIFAEHILLIGTTELREENKRLRVALVSKGCDDIFCEEANRSCDKCQVRYPDKMRAIKKEDANNFLFSVPF